MIVCFVDVWLRVSQLSWLDVKSPNVVVVFHLLNSDVLQKHSAIVNLFDLRLQVSQLFLLDVQSHNVVVVFHLLGSDA